MAEEFTAKFRVDITDLKKGIQEANKQINLANAQFKAASAGMDNWAKSTDGVKAKISQLTSTLTAQNTKLQNYEDQLKEQRKAYEENGKLAQKFKTRLEELANQGVKKNSEEYRKYQKALTEATKEQNNNEKSIRDLETTILNQKGAIAGTEKELRNYRKALKDLEDGEEGAKKKSEALTVAWGTFIGNLGTKAVDLAVNAIKRLADAVIDVGKQAIASYADYEQLIGGVETLFKDSAPIVENYANNAYKSAGLSANQYMETVTSFSASLLQSLGQDTEKAAKYADMAIIDMSDNANRMGTDMASIQHAYQGFAKQNYTMLDNLKLGYGGTKEEMERLIADANRVKEANGEMADLSIDSFADVTEAIHIIQTEMGITGTTAKEASTTIQGSAASMEAAWQNLMTGIADENQNFELLVKNFADSVITYMSNMFPRIQQVLVGVTNLFRDYLPELMRTFYAQISDGVAEMGSQGTQLVMALVTSLIEALPLLIDGGIRMIGGILDGLGQAIPHVVETVVQVIPQIVQALANGLPDLIQGGITLLMGIVEAVPVLVQELMIAVPQIIDSIIDILVQGIPELINGATQLLMAIVDAIPEIVPVIVDNIPTIIDGVVRGLVNGIEVLIDGAVQLFTAIVDAIPIIIPVIVQQLPTIIDAIVTVLTENIPLLLEGAIELFMALVDAIPTVIVELAKAIPEIITSILDSLAPLATDLDAFFTEAWSAIKEVFAPVGEWFSEKFNEAKTAVEEIWNTVATWFSDNVVEPIKEFFAPLVEWFTELFKSIWDYIASVFEVIGQLAEGCVLIIQTAWGIVADWFNENVITPITTFFTDMWNSISEFASEAWTKIQEVWSVVSGWFNTNIVQPVRNFFSDMWTGLKQGASDAWKGIQSVFKPVAEWFETKFKNAWQKVKNVFSTGGKIFDGIKEGITAAFKQVVNAIIRGINKVVATPFNAINKVLDKIRSANILGIKPFSSLGRISVPQIPTLAMGGVLKRGQLGLLEGDGAEAVVPLEKNKKWIKAVADDLLNDLKGGVGSSVNANSVVNNKDYTFTQNIYAPKQPSRIELYRQTRNLLSYAQQGSM